MNKRTLLGLLFLTSSTLVLAEENITNEHISEIVIYSETIVDANNSIITFDEVNESKETRIEENTLEETVTVSSGIENSIVEDESRGKETVVEEVSTDEESEVGEVSPYLSALKSAKEDDKVILLAIRATDCHYCDRMEEETLSDESVKRALDEDFVTLHYNQDLEPLPLGLQEGMTPNFIFVDKEENIINMYPGMRTPSEFKEALEQILSQ